VDERRDQPAAGTEARVIPEGAGRLSPVQEAWAAYVYHSVRACIVCRTPDAGHCETAEELHRRYTDAADAAARELWGR
jgi:hypothetical protein